MYVNYTLGKVVSSPQHLTKWLRRLACWYVISFGSSLKTSEVITAMAKMPQSVPPDYCCIGTITILLLLFRPNMRRIVLLLSASSLVKTESYTIAWLLLLHFVDITIQCSHFLQWTIWMLFTVLCPFTFVICSNVDLSPPTEGNWFFIMRCAKLICLSDSCLPVSMVILSLTSKEHLSNVTQTAEWFRLYVYCQSLYCGHSTQLQLVQLNLHACTILVVLNPYCLMMMFDVH